MPAECSVPDCTGSYLANGLCQRHYSRMRRYGRLDRISKLERFESHLKFQDRNGCWVWDKPNPIDGYGQFFGPAHRWSYEHHIGPIPEGLHLDHLCRNRACVNPWHLEPVTAAENIRRGESPYAINARRTHCVHGHEFTTDNTYMTPDGRRQCRRCISIRSSNHKKKHSTKELI